MMNKRLMLSLCYEGERDVWSSLHYHVVNVLPPVTGLDVQVQIQNIIIKTHKKDRDQQNQNF